MSIQSVDVFQILNTFHGQIFRFVAHHSAFSHVNEDSRVNGGLLQQFGSFSEDKKVNFLVKKSHNRISLWFFHFYQNFCGLLKVVLKVFLQFSIRLLLFLYGPSPHFVLSCTLPPQPLKTFFFARIIPSLVLKNLRLLLSSIQSPDSFHDGSRNRGNLVA